MQSVSEFLAENVARLHLSDMPELVVKTAKQGILDTVGVTFAGGREASVKSVRTALQLDGAALKLGASTIFADFSKSSALDAAMVNGTAAHALDFDDCNNTMGGHPSAPIVPALWALAEQLKCSGAEFLASYIAGVEVETKVGASVNFHHYEKGWHPTATLGTIGVAAACGRLLRLPVDTLSHAIALSTSMASGIKANFGTPTKPFHVGQTARQGMLAALLAKSGLKANLDAFEHPQGFGMVYNGAGHFDWSGLRASWGAPWDLAEPGLAFKQHPCCASTHPAIDALLDILKQHQLQPTEIQKIASFTHPRRFAHTNRPNPKNGLDGKFSVQYVLACAALNGIVAVDDFTDESLESPAVRTMMSKIGALADPHADMSSYEHFYADVEVTTVDGRLLRKHVDRPVGRDRNHPLPEGALEQKFLACTRNLLSEKVQSQFIQHIACLEDIDSISEITHELCRTEG
jgi:2-methylcitrate dehydratase PrpD